MNLAIGDRVQYTGLTYIKCIFEITSIRYHDENHPYEMAVVIVDDNVNARLRNYWHVGKSAFLSKYEIEDNLIKKIGQTNYIQKNTFRWNKST